MCEAPKSVDAEAKEDVMESKIAPVVVEKALDNHIEIMTKLVNEQKAPPSLHSHSWIFFIYIYLGFFFLGY